jgi:Fuc2NAc and GlcNAc transferase
MTILLLSFALSAIFSYGYIYYARRKQWLDIPNARSSHTQLTPRGGGLVFILLWVIACLVGFFFAGWQLQPLAVLLPGAVLVAVVGFYDDRHGLSARWRAFAYIIAAVISIVMAGGFPAVILNTHFTLPLGWLGAMLAVLAIVWSTNLFNFMDGLDGIAAMEALFTLGIGGYFFYQTGAQEIAFITWLLAACVTGFLVWNRPPAKVFMGDVGSATLGFIVMVLAIYGEKQYGVPLLLWLIMYGVFIFDATVTLLRRLLRKEKVYQAHRLHAYQRLHQAGFSHGQALLMVSITNLWLAMLAMAGFYFQVFLPLFLGVALLTLIILYWLVERIKPMYR